MQRRDNLWIDDRLSVGLLCMSRALENKIIAKASTGITRVLENVGAVLSFSMIIQDDVVRPSISAVRPGSGRPGGLDR